MKHRAPRAVPGACATAPLLAVAELASGFLEAPAAAPEFRSGAAIVRLDVIARDRAGRPVRDLRPEQGGTAATQSTHFELLP